MTIDRELGFAQGIGMNTMRVFLHDIAWKEDPQGFYSRVDEYLKIADKHGIKTLFVIFDAVWYPNPHAGKQPDRFRDDTIPVGCNRRDARTWSRPRNKMS